MAKPTRKQVETFIKPLQVDLVTADATRPAGKNDKTPPHQLIAAAVTREVSKKLRALDAPPEILETLAAREVERWNHYLTFAFDRKESTAAFYKEHEQDIKYVVECCQKGILKSQLDRQMIWRFKQTPREIEVRGEKIPNPLAGAYQDMAVAHNTGLILGTIGKVLSSPNVHTDLDVSDFTANAIEDIRKRMERYDPTRAAFSTFMTKPVEWGVQRMLKGNAQERFDRTIRRGLHQHSDEESGRVSGIEAEAPRDRDGTDGLAFIEYETREALFHRLREAGKKLGGRAKMVFDYKIDHPVSTLEEVGRHCHCTRENVRQGMAEIGRQLPRIDPELAAYVKAMINRDEEGMDDERLAKTYDASPLQKRAKALLDAVEAEMGAMESSIGRDNILARNGTLRISSAATRGNGALKQVAEDLTATYEALQIIRDIVQSPFVDAGFDVLSITQIQKLAFYPGGSKELEAFVENNIEALADAGRKKLVSEFTANPARLAKAKSLVDRFYDSTSAMLGRFGKNEINALFCAPESSNGEVLNASDLLIVRQMGVASVKHEALHLRS